jgi:hypothetical protein
MSEAADLNSDPNFERMLRELEPQRLEVSRDALFFQAGFAAGAMNRSRRFFWPAIAAALLIACGGTAVFALRQHSDLLAALAAAERPHSPLPLAIDDGAKPQTVGAVVDRFSSDERLRDFRRLISLGPLPPGRLTAGGWQEAGAETGNVGGGANRSGENEPLPPHRPATYLELLHRYQEG